MPGPNLLAALKAHLQTGEVPETLRESLGGAPSTVPVQAPIDGHDGMDAHPVHRASAYPVARRSAPRDRVTPVTPASQRLSIEDLGGLGDAPAVTEEAALGIVPEKVTPAGEREPALPDPDPLHAPEQPRPQEVDWVHRVNFFTGSCEKCRMSPAEMRATPVCPGEPEAVGWRHQSGGDRRRAKEAAEERARGRVTTDETLEADLQASLEAANRPSAINVDQPGTCPRHGFTLVQRFREEQAGDPDEVLTEACMVPLGRWDCLRCLDEDPQPAVVHKGTAGVLVDPDHVVEATLGVQAAIPTAPASPTFEIPVDLPDLPLFAYVRGAAGVGKTFWAREVARRAGDAVVLAATTGIASVNLGEGTTINALLKYFDTASLREAFTGGFLEAMLKKHRTLGLQRILLDEVSMLSGEQLTILCRAIDNVNEDRPEGVPELGLLLLGDFAQLSPVPDRDPADPKGFRKLPIQFAFESAEWERFRDHTYVLQTIRRQADKAFTEALQAVRAGRVGAALEFFRDRFSPTTDMNFPGPTLVAKNDAVGKFNQLRLDAVRGARVGFPSQRWGKLRPEWGGPGKPPAEWGVPEVLQLKEGARVMILANKNIADEGALPVWAYTNGDLGTFLGEHAVAKGTARVLLDRTGSEVNVGPLNRFNEIPLEPGRRKALKAEGHPERVSSDGKREYIGGITYVPLRLAYATTVHKSQGLSLDKVQVNIRDSFFAQPGMLYVALSRARSAEGLRLVGTPEGFRARCTVNPKLKEFL